MLIRAFQIGDLVVGDASARTPTSADESRPESGIGIVVDPTCCCAIGRGLPDGYLCDGGIVWSGRPHEAVPHVLVRWPTEAGSAPRVSLHRAADLRPAPDHFVGRHADG